MAQSYGHASPFAVGSAYVVRNGISSELHLVLVVPYFPGWVDFKPTSVFLVGLIKSGFIFIRLRTMALPKKQVRTLKDGLKIIEEEKNPG